MKKESGNKKAMNPLLKSLIKTGAEKEKQVQKASSIEEMEQTETIEKNQVPAEAEKLPEEMSTEKNETETPVEDLPEKINDKAGNRNSYEKLTSKRNDREVVFLPIKISTAHNNLLKKISVAEKVSMQDILANIIDSFSEEYQKEIKISMKKLLS